MNSCSLNMRYALPIMMALMVLGCAEGGEEAIPAIPKLDPLPLEASYPADNPWSRERFVLGWRLFYDPILSGTKDVACGTCHHPTYGMSDGRAVSLGAGASGLGPNRKPDGAFESRTRRNSLSIVNAAFAPAFFWDGRTTSLEAQALIPIASHREMRGDAYAEHAAVDSVIARLRKIGLYERDFRLAFKESADSVAQGLLPSAITRSTLARAIAAFERKLIAPFTKFDGFLRGDSIFTTEEREGLELFTGKAGCIRCHNGPMLTDYRFYSQAMDNPVEDDAGRGDITGDPSDNYKFRSPTLRNLSKTAPYMHAGTLGTLEEIIEYYNRASAHEAQNVDPSFRPLGLKGAEKRVLLQFLQTLSDDSWQPFAEPPASVYSGLPVPHH